MQHRNITGDSFFSWDGEVLVVNILGKPAAKVDAIGEPLGNQLRVSVKAKPEDGKATDYMVKFLAPLFGVRASDIEISAASCAILAAFASSSAIRFSSEST